MRNAGLHEDLNREDTVKSSSDRSFGLVFTVLFAILAAVAAARGSGWAWTWGVAAVLVLAVAVTVPRLLAPFNHLWMRFGLLLHKLVQPIVLGLLFFVTVTPIGLLMRLAGHDPLSRRFDPDAETYWIARQPPGPAPGSLDRQF
jgi:Saxitoxin biosynthesis operon protein SxtJ